MNERIKQISDQVWEWAENQEYSEPDQFSDIWETKFAELIVKECADKVAGMIVMDKGYIPQDPHSQGWNSAVAYASKELKKQFGVEE